MCCCQGLCALCTHPIGHLLPRGSSGYRSPFLSPLDLNRLGFAEKPSPLLADEAPVESWEKTASRCPDNPLFPISEIISPTSQLVPESDSFHWVFILGLQFGNPSTFSSPKSHYILFDLAMCLRFREQLQCSSFCPSLDWAICCVGPVLILHFMILTLCYLCEHYCRVFEYFFMPLCCLWCDSVIVLPWGPLLPCV